MEYKVINENSLTELEKEVNNHLSSGWKLKGGISVSRAKYNTGIDELKYFQAMTK